VAQNVAHRSGWITFAGVMALIAGGYNALSGHFLILFGLLTQSDEFLG
jgi:hypothetical protein